MNIASRLIRKIRIYRENKKYKNVAPGVVIPDGITVSVKDNLVIKEGGSIEPGALILNVNAKFVVGRYSGAGPNLTVITGNHMSVVGKYLMSVTEADKKELDPDGRQDQDVMLEDDVWLGANVTLLNGARVCRGAVVAAGTVVRSKIPPYAIVAGNPAKVVGFRFTPEQVIEHESILYPENDRLESRLLERNYKKYYLDRLTEINSYCRI